MNDAIAQANIAVECGRKLIIYRAQPMYGVERAISCSRRYIACSFDEQAIGVNSALYDDLRQALDDPPPPSIFQIPLNRHLQVRRCFLNVAGYIGQLLLDQAIVINAHEP